MILVEFNNDSRFNVYLDEKMFEVADYMGGIGLVLVVGRNAHHHQNIFVPCCSMHLQSLEWQFVLYMTYIERLEVNYPKISSIIISDSYRFRYGAWYFNGNAEFELNKEEKTYISNLLLLNTSLAKKS